MTILTTSKGTSWTSHGFGATWRKTLTKAKVSGLTFHDLRSTAVTRLAVAGCEVPEIATITCHSLKDVGAILDAYYLNRNTRLAESAIRKLEEYERETKTPNWPKPVAAKSEKAVCLKWQGHQGSNPRPTVLETVALPTELYPCGAAFPKADVLRWQEEKRAFCVQACGLAAAGFAMAQPSS